jgi:hypothetical protein
MWAGYIGPNYRPGGLVLVAYFPAGGTAPYANTARAARDEAFYALIGAFKRADPESRIAAFEALNLHVAEAMPHWRMYKVIEVVLEAAGCSLDDVALINLVPYRIADNASPRAKVIQASWEACTAPALQVLQPGKVAALGAGPGRALEARGVQPLYIFPRTIGDSYVNPKAYDVARQLSRGRRSPEFKASPAAAVAPALTHASAPKPARTARSLPADLHHSQFRLGPHAPSTTSVHGKIRAAVGRRPGLSGADLLAELRKIDFSQTQSPHTAHGTPSDDWFIGYIRGGLRRGYLKAD